jgi:flavin reductase (DIM6/NTAB) family NADH-FMN oxidoreductase RutF
VDAFTTQVGSLDYPMAVVTAASGTTNSGCLVGFISQCSIHPPRVMVWISQANHTHDIALRSSHLAVHWLSTLESGTAQLFGTQTGDEVDKFVRCAWNPGPGGVPVLLDCRRWFVGRVLDHFDHGDHTGFLLEPVDAQTAEPWPGQLGYQAVRNLDPGHDP